LNRDRYHAAGLYAEFLQDNLFFSQQNVLRGLHCQNPHAQGKLVQVLQGEVFDVAVDIRQGSPHFGQWFGTHLSADNRLQMYIPPGFAHGFCVTSETALFSYKCTDLYSPATEFTLLWDDPDVGIAWPVGAPSLSAKDVAGMKLRDIPESTLPVFDAP
jgi:dTDP-4-dehydrorhamnose 3,5-epimerase